MFDLIIRMINKRKERCVLEFQQIENERTLLDLHLKETLEWKHRICGEEGTIY